jgi:hypothetical protein
MAESAAGLPVVREGKDGDRWGFPARATRPRRRYLGPVVAQCRQGLPTHDELGAGEERDLPVILS